MNCSGCGAPLPPKSNICEFCKTLNDTDLRRVDGDVDKRGASELPCPRCETRLSTVEVALADSFRVERCDSCLGIFFDPGELELLIDASVSHAGRVDPQRIAKLVEEEVSTEFLEVRYVPCPVCSRLMNRKAYGARSGVIIDWCKDHGVWLDVGELGQLLKWTRAGGPQLDRKVEEERSRLELSASRSAIGPRALNAELFGSSQSSRSLWHDLLDLVNGLLR